MNPQPVHILREGPFFRTGEPTRANVSLLALLSPILISVPFFHEPNIGAAWGWPLALGGGFLAVLFFAPDRRACLARMDWAATSVIAGLMPALPANHNLEISVAVCSGIICGWLSAWPRAAKLLGRPGLIPVTALALTLLLVGTISRLMAIQTKPIYFRWGLMYWPQLFALAAAGFCFATRRRSFVYWWLPWVVAATSFFLIPPPPMQSGFLNQPDIYILGRLAIFMVPMFFIAPQMARSKLELAAYEALALLFLFFPPPKVGLLYQGLDPAVFLLVLSFWPVRKLFKQNPVAVKFSVPSASEAKAFIKCGHNGDAFKLSEWRGLPSCRLATAHGGGPLACPYGCPGFGDCVRACQFNAIKINDQPFPVIDPTACRGCGRCAEVCPKKLIEMVKGEPRALIPCFSKSNLKKNAVYCRHSCLGCGRCRKACPAGAITREGSGGAMKIDPGVCGAFGEACERVCVKVCPRKIIKGVRP